MTRLIEDNQRCLRDGAQLLRALPLDFYRRAFPEGAGASVGDHLRHNIDHYDCFLRGIEPGRIDYDARSRDEDVAKDPEAAVATLERIDSALDRLTSADLERPVRIQMDSGSGEGGDSWMPSTLGRELQFLISHTIHHYALIAILCRMGGIEPGKDFGVAPSTLRFRGAALSH